MAKKLRKRLNRRNRGADLVAALLLCGFLVLGAFWLHSYIRSRMVQFEVVESGSIAITLPGELFVVRQEVIIAAPTAGDFVPLAAEGERVRSGSVIGYLGLTPVHAPRGGVVSYILDGWEDALSRDVLDELNLDLIFQILAEQSALQTTPQASQPPLDNVASGRPLARIVDNLIDYTVLLKVRDEEDMLAELTRLQFNLPDGSSHRPVIRDQGETAAGFSYFVFNISSSVDEFLYLRYSTLEVVADDLRGILIPSSAIFTNEYQQTGVLILRRRQLVFQEVVELASLDGWSVVEGLNDLAHVVTNPASAYAGQRIH